MSTTARLEFRRYGADADDDVSGTGVIAGKRDATASSPTRARTSIVRTTRRNARIRVFRCATRGKGFMRERRILTRNVDVARVEDVMAKRILAPVDTHEDSDMIVPVLAGLARGAGASIRLLRVFPVPERVVGPQGRTIAYSDQEMARLTAEGLRELRQVESQMEGVPVESVIRFGEPVEEILSEADAFGADLVAFATPRRGLRQALGLGVAPRVIRKSPVPALVLLHQ